MGESCVLNVQRVVLVLKFQHHPWAAIVSQEESFIKVDACTRLPLYPKE